MSFSRILPSIIHEKKCELTHYLVIEVSLLLTCFHVSFVNDWNFTNSDISDSPSITRISEGVIVNAKEDATLSCTVHANPLDENTITWKRDDFPNFSERTSIVYDKNGTSYLKISQVTREDLGNFQCKADNGIGNSTVRNVMLIIKRNKTECKFCLGF